MEVSQFVQTAQRIARDFKSMYIMGCFGAPMNEKNKKRYSQNNAFNKKQADKILAASPDVFGWDCVCLVKSILWEWSGDVSKTYGGATYQSNGVPDIGANAMIKACKDVSTDFSSIIPGELLWMEKHVGIYVGNGLCVEATAKWDSKVQVSTVLNVFPDSMDSKRRKWTKHGKLPWVDYSEVKICPYCGRPMP